MAGKSTSSKTSLIITVFNEEKTLDRLLSSFKKQTLSPAEIIIVDGGSKDATYSLLQHTAQKNPVLKVFQVSGNRSVGRNFAVSKARFPLLAFTDAGCILEDNWLEELVQPFKDSNTQVVSGYYKGIAANTFQACVVPYVLVMPDRIDPNHFLPSTRSMAMRKSAWEKYGGFDPKLNHNEDYAYAKWLEKAGCKFVFAPKAVVGWLPRKNLKQTAWMFMRFAIGDIQSGIFRPKVKFLFLRYFVFIYLVLLAVKLPFLFPYLFAAMCAYLVWSVVKNYHYVKKIAALFWLPVLQITADISVIFGTFVGFLAKAYGLL